mmetsp:Transcript_37994/g.80051  ORF Transcript_37994/g.80051 Transcript_37994/m.80051 type:complete len:343 (-) Transcript_37994:169-1197(-)
MTFPSGQQRRPNPATIFGATPSIQASALIRMLMLMQLMLTPQHCQSIHLDVHVPLPTGCIKYQALHVNNLLRKASRAAAQQSSDGGDDAPPPSENVDLFSRHTPHVTLYLADFDLEAKAIPATGDGDDAAANELNQTKVDEFLGAISALNLTEMIAGWNCPLSLSNEYSTPSSTSYYKINGAYTMLPIEDTPCLQTLSTALLHSLQSYLKQPIEVPSWVASLPEPDRSSAIYRSRTYGSPNVLEGFDPHVTVGFDPSGADAPEGQQQWREDAMRQWNDAYEQVRETCMDEVQGIALGKNGVGGTVLADSRMGYWELPSKPKAHLSRNGLRSADRNRYYAAEE